MKTLLHCPDIAKAHILKSRLESEGILSAIVNENTPTCSLCPTLENQGIRILVDESQYQQARRIVESTYRLPVPCPACHSQDTHPCEDNGIHSLREILRRLLRGAPQNYRCRTCGTIFHPQDR